MAVDSEEEVKLDLKMIEESDDLNKKKSLKSEVSTTICKPGIVYLSTIPPGMNVKQIREYFTQFGEIERSFLQPEKSSWKGKKKNQTFTEGWIEFKKRRHARKVAHTLNNNPVGGKKRKLYHDFLWNIKYLPGFHWVHLNERLAYERISKKQKLRTEISAAKREVNFFAKSVDMSKNLKRKGFLSTSNESTSGIEMVRNSETITIQADDTEAVKNNSGLTEDRKNFLRSFFSK